MPGYRNPDPQPPATHACPTTPAPAVETAGTPALSLVASSVHTHLRAVVSEATLPAPNGKNIQIYVTVRNYTQACAHLLGATSSLDVS